MNTIEKYLLQNPAHIKEFSKRAYSYESYNIIQKEVARKLVCKISSKPKRILDIGCGSGEIFKNIHWQTKLFVGVDLSKAMCKLHPKHEGVEIICADFEDKKLYRGLEKFAPFDLVISSSALQWAKDIDKVFFKLSSLGEHWLFGIFCNKTFKTISKITSVPSILPNSKDVIDCAKKYKNCQFETIEYRLFFQDNLSKFRYIKKSGVSGGEKKLNYLQTKNLIKNYPLPYLEFEVLYISSI